MLVLRRIRGESVVIGKNAEIVVKVLGDNNGSISLGFKAPKDVPVDRLEVYENRQKELDAQILIEKG
jgi:carbon storage regulator